MPKGVACTVSNCHYWAENNQCAATEIFIDLDAHARSTSKHRHDAEFATDLAEAPHKDKAKKSAETCCLTFVAKKKER